MGTLLRARSSSRDAGIPERLARDKKLKKTKKSETGRCVAAPTGLAFRSQQGLSRADPQKGRRLSYHSLCTDVEKDLRFDRKTLGGRTACSGGCISF